MVFCSKGQIFADDWVNAYKLCTGTKMTDRNASGLHLRVFEFSSYLLKKFLQYLFTFFWHVWIEAEIVEWDLRSLMM